MKDKESHSVYFAGDLFNIKDLLGNVAVARAVEKFSDGKFFCALPQDFQAQCGSPKGIRDCDIFNLLSSDAGIFNFDGSELDSGTVVEFMLAKFADIPAVVLRTDFRNGGDAISIAKNSGEENEYHPWNLMASFYPRTKVLTLDAMRIYKEYANDENPLQGAVDDIARQVAQALSEVVAMPPLMKKESKDVINNWIVSVPNLSEEMKEKLFKILSDK